MQTDRNSRLNVLVLIIPLLLAIAWLFSSGVANSQTTELPSGSVLHFDLAACPSGWSDLSSAQGRYLVGRPSGAAAGSVTGTALTNLENRPVGQHNHTVDDPGHSHSVNDPGHSHAASDNGHNHNVTDPGHSHYLDGIQHRGGTNGDGNGSPRFAAESNRNTGSAQTGITLRTGHADLVVETNLTGLTVDVQSATNVAIVSEGVHAGTNAPYIQLMVCQKD